MGPEQIQSDLRVDLQEGYESISIRYIPVRIAVTWILEGNPKEHDLQKIADSIALNGFRDPPTFDTNLTNLNGGQGALVEGNGRTEALWWMERHGNEILAEAGLQVPRGIALTAEDEWAMPVIFGLDADSEAAAKRYSIDHNNLVAAGGTFTALDVSRMFNSQKYLAFIDDLNSSGHLPLTIDADDFALLQQHLGSQQENALDPSNSDPAKLDDDGIEYQNKYAVAVECRDESHQEEVYKKLTAQGFKCKVLVL